MNEGIFPESFKQQKLVLIPKSRKLTSDPSSLRPLCMINSDGKIFERIVAKRIEEAMNSNALSENQYGFRKGRSTTDAVNRVINLAKDAISGKRWKRGKIEYCVLVTLDIKTRLTQPNGIPS